MRNKTTLIFDMDGVIANTKKHHQDAWFKFCKKHGLHITGKMFRDKLFGRTSHEILEILFDRQLSENESEKLTTEKEEMYRNQARDQLEPLPGLQTFLEKARKENFDMIVASSAPGKNVEFTLDETGTLKYFEDFIAAEDITESKPDPEIFLKAAERLKSPPANCVVFEDSYAGIDAGKNAGMKVIAVATTHPKNELSKADLVIDDFSNLTNQDL